MRPVAEHEEQLRRFLQLFGGSDGGVEARAGHDGTVIRQEERAVCEIASAEIVADTD